jgi:hypothetical protein
MWIRLFVLNPVTVWQDNCFMAIHFTAAILADLGGGVVTVVGNMQLVLPKITTLPATRGVGLVQIANELTDCF